MSYLSASAVVIHYEEALYEVYAPLPLPKWYEHKLSEKSARSVLRFKVTSSPKVTQIDWVPIYRVPSNGSVSYLFGGKRKLFPFRV